jgi:hypothetical protein
MKYAPRLATLFYWTQRESIATLTASAITGLTWFIQQLYKLYWILSTATLAWLSLISLILTIEYLFVVKLIRAHGTPSISCTNHVPFYLHS